MGAARKLHATEVQPKIDYDALEKERAAQVQLSFQRRLTKEFENQGTSLRRLVLQNVVNGDYSMARQLINAFMLTKEEFPAFRPRVKPLAKHCEDLIGAIETKRNFQNMHLLNISKQKEILDYVLDHFNELKHVLKNIERIAGDEVATDFRSTRWFLKTVSWVVLGVTVAAFLISFSEDIGRPFWAVYADISKNLSEHLFKVFGI